MREYELNGGAAAGRRSNKGGEAERREVTRSKVEWFFQVKDHPESNATLGSFLAR